MDVWQEIELYEGKLILNLPGDFSSILAEEIPDDITPIFPQYAFTNTEDVFILVKADTYEIQDTMDEVKKIYDVLKNREKDFQLIMAQQRILDEVSQAMMCYTTDVHDKQKYYMLTLCEFNGVQCLYLSCCLYSEKNRWEPIFNQIIDSIKVRIGERDGQK